MQILSSPRTLQAWKRSGAFLCTHHFPEGRKMIVNLCKVCGGKVKHHQYV